MTSAMEQSLPTEEALEPQDPQPARGSNFVLAVAASLLLHGIATVLIVGLPGGPSQQQSVTYLDLSMAQPAAAPVAAPAPQRKAEPAPVPEKPSLAEKAEAPEPAQAEQPKPAPEQTAPPQEKRADEHLPHTSLGLGLTRGFFKSIGEGETLRVGVKEYYLDMLQNINEKWWLDQELQKGRIRPIMINLTIARNGAIVGSEILMSSGNVRYDKAVLAALTAASPLPPLPPSYQGDFFEAPVRLVPPLNLLNW
jgi:periplasmic protein TonB